MNFMNAKETSQLFDYLIDTRTKFLAKFRDVGWEAFTKNRQASWGSMLGIFLHILDVEDSWLHYALRGLALDALQSPDPAQYAGFERVNEYESRISTKTRALMAKLSDSDLEKEVEFKESTGTTRRAVSKIIMHAFIDELAHVGELICILWQLDVKPPYIDWLDYQLT